MQYFQDSSTLNFPLLKDISIKKKTQIWIFALNNHFRNFVHCYITLQNIFFQCLRGKGWCPFWITGDGKHVNVPVILIRSNFNCFDFLICCINAVRIFANKIQSNVLWQILKKTNSKFILRICNKDFFQLKTVFFLNFNWKYDDMFSIFLAAPF